MSGRSTTALVNGDVVQHQDKLVVGVVSPGPRVPSPAARCPESRFGQHLTPSFVVCLSGAQITTRQTARVFTNSVKVGAQHRHRRPLPACRGPGRRGLVGLRSCLRRDHWPSHDVAIVHASRDCRHSSNARSLISRPRCKPTRAPSKRRSDIVASMFAHVALSLATSRPRQGRPATASGTSADRVGTPIPAIRTGATCRRHDRSG